MANNEVEAWLSSEKYTSELQTLPTALRGEFEELVRIYRYLAAVNHKNPFVSYKVLAGLIRDGWRRVGEAVNVFEDS